MYIACFCHEVLHFKNNIFGGKAEQQGSTLKTAVFDQPSDLSFDRQSTQHYFFYKIHTCFVKKKFSCQILRFLTNFQAKYIPNKGCT
jgi:hypothetical protein